MNTFCHWLNNRFITFARLSGNIKKPWNFPGEIWIINNRSQILIENLWIIMIIYNLSNIFSIILFILSPERSWKSSIMAITNLPLFRITKSFINKFMSRHKINRIICFKQWLRIPWIHPILQANLPSGSILNHRAIALMIWPPARLLSIIRIQTRLTLLRTLFYKFVFLLFIFQSKLIIGDQLSQWARFRIDKYFSFFV